MSTSSNFQQHQPLPSLQIPSPFPPNFHPGPGMSRCIPPHLPPLYVHSDLHKDTGWLSNPCLSVTLERQQEDPTTKPKPQASLYETCSALGRAKSRQLASTWRSLSQEPWNHTHQDHGETSVLLEICDLSDYMMFWKCFFWHRHSLWYVFQNKKSTCSNDPYFTKLTEHFAVLTCLYNQP